MAHGVTCTVTIVYTPPSPHTYLSVLFDDGGLCLLLFSASVQDADKWEVGRLLTLAVVQSMNESSQCNMAINSHLIKHTHTHTLNF